MEYINSYLDFYLGYKRSHSRLIKRVDRVKNSSTHLTRFNQFIHNANLMTYIQPSHITRTLLYLTQSKNIHTKTKVRVQSERVWDRVRVRETRGGRLRLNNLFNTQIILLGFTILNPCIIYLLNITTQLNIYIYIWIK